MAILLVVCGASSRPSNRAMASSSSPSSGSPSGSPSASGRNEEGAAQNATLKPASAVAADIPFLEYDTEAEHVLFDLANQSRVQAGAPPLALDRGLSQAARAHAQEMFAARQLSHRFEGELSLPQRLANATRTQLDQEGENVAFDFDAAKGHQHLMLSPPHRANLLNPAYNVVGLGVVRSGDRLYIVQDFGHALPNYSPAQVKERVVAAVNQTRLQASVAQLQRRDLPAADSDACSMAQADKLGTAPVRKLAERATVLTYTSLHPETLPAGALHAIASRTLHSFSVGACYSRTDTYPTGVYWVVLSLE